MKKAKNRKKVYKYLFEYEGEEAFCTLDLTGSDGGGWAYYSDIEVKIHKRYRKTNPDLGVWLVKWYHALSNAGYPKERLTQKRLRIVNAKYHDKYYSDFYFPHFRATYGKPPWNLPFMNKTEAIQEFIARGFKHEDDVKIDRLKKYCVRCTIAPLWWPEDFDSQSDAIQYVQTKFGIHGYTSVTNPRQ